MDSMYILLADDDEDDCLLFQEALSELSLSIQLTVVHDGEQLMQLLTKNSEHLPHILFLDLNMPRKNGHECLSDIKQNENLKHLPVVILSTAFEQEVAELLYKNGAQHCIRKPADFSQLKQVIQQALTLIARGDISQPPKESFVIEG